MKRKQLYNLALFNYGIQTQLIVLCEEMSELAKVVLKDLRNSTISTHELIDEIADVEIMLEQVKLIYKLDRKLIYKRKDFKKQRLLKSLKEKEK